MTITMQQYVTGINGGNMKRPARNASFAIWHPKLEVISSHQSLDAAQYAFVSMECRPAIRSECYILSKRTNGEWLPFDEVSKEEVMLFEEKLMLVKREPNPNTDYCVWHPLYGAVSCHYGLKRTLQMLEEIKLKHPAEADNYQIYGKHANKNWYQIDITRSDYPFIRD